MIVASGHQLRTPNTPEKQMHNTKRHYEANVTVKLYACLIDALPDDIRSIDLYKIRLKYREIVKQIAVWDDTKDEGNTFEIDKEKASFLLAGLLWDIAEPYTMESADVAGCRKELERVIKGELKCNV